MKTMRNFMLLLFGVLALAGMSACSSNSDDDRVIDETNPQIGTWYAEKTSSQTSRDGVKTFNYIIRVSHIIKLTKSGTFYSEYNNCFTPGDQETVDFLKKKFNLSSNVNEEAVYKSCIDEGYYTWDNSTKKAKITLEKKGGTHSTSSTIAFSFSPDYNTTTISWSGDGYFNDKRYERR